MSDQDAPKFTLIDFQAARLRKSLPAATKMDALGFHIECLKRELLECNNLVGELYCDLTDEQWTQAAAGLLRIVSGYNNLRCAYCSTTNGGDAA